MAMRHESSMIIDENNIYIVSQKNITSIPTYRLYIYANKSKYDAVVL